ncbi:hypothetical protein T06_12582 [Trichinella sp. T6]|nr:hypothetical protein T06_12582 [Trichinella sp. T6]
MLHIKQPVNHKWSVNSIVQDGCTIESMRNFLNNCFIELPSLASFLGWVTETSSPY